MQEVTLKFFERFKLADLLGVQEGKVAEIRILTKIIEKVDLTEEEKAAAQYAMNAANGLVTWRLPEGDDAFGTKTVDLEDAEADKIRQVIDNWPRFKPADKLWFSAVLDGLKKKQ